jgi:hypothetical protein
VQAREAAENTPSKMARNEADTRILRRLMSDQGQAIRPVDYNNGWRR